MAKEKLTPIEQLEKLNQKINKLKMQQQKVQKTFEEKITNLLKKKNAFHHDFNILYGAILDICEKLNDQQNNKDQISVYQEKGTLALSKKKKNDA
ncbi:MAG: hypothetical protein CNLJKLNK_01374 [Holosporales bacterium]